MAIWSHCVLQRKREKEGERRGRKKKERPGKGKKEGKGGRERYDCETYGYLFDTRIKKNVATM